MTNIKSFEISSLNSYRQAWLHHNVAPRAILIQGGPRKTGPPSCRPTWA